MSRKRLRTSSESTCMGLKSVFAIERAPKPVIKGRKTSTIDDEKIYLESEPPGKDTKDMIMTNTMLTNLICPKVHYKIRHYGYNFAGGHKFATANIHNGGGIDTISVGPPLNPPQTDSRRFIFQGDVINQADTIAWTAGTQGWYESLSLPGTWTAPNWPGETAVATQPSMVGLINAGKYGMLHMNSQSLFANPNDATATSADFTVCYRGGTQKHTFVNNSEVEVFYEIWELTPRDIVYDWIRTEFDTNNNGFGSFDNIHSFVSYAKRHQHTVLSNATAESAVNKNGTYLVSLLSNNYNSDGQQCSNKNDVGFRINSNCLDLYHKFRVSKSQKGSMKSGSSLTYNLKHGPFTIRNSVWNRWVTGQRTELDLNSMDDPQNTMVDANKYGHLVPCATKILVCRFWSELGTKGQFETNETTSFKFNYKDVTYLPGRIIHTVQENHSIRVVPYVKNNQYIEKNFTKIDYTADSAQTDFEFINDEGNSNETTQLTTGV